MFPSKMKIRDLVISPPVALAPMVGLSHSAMRSLILELGGVGIFFTEMLSAKRLPQENENISSCLIRTQEEYPLFYQVYLNDSALIVPALDKLERINAQGIDINFGCPAPKLRKQGAGCFLAKDHSMVKKIVSTFRRNTELPLTAKIRLGDSLEEKTFKEFCHIIEGEGADCLTVHARLNKEKFCRKPRWQWIKKAKRYVKIPVIANGGIFTTEDAYNCMKISGADGLMIGRGAAWRPWIFSDIAEILFGIPNKREKRKVDDIYFRFIELLKERFSQERQLGRLKQFTHYFAGTFSFGHLFASNIQNSNTIEQASERAATFFKGKKIHKV